MGEGLRYVFEPLTSASNSDDAIFHIHSSSTSSWDIVNSVREMFRGLSINMVFTSHPKEDDGEIELLKSEVDPWISHFNAL